MKESLKLKNYANYIVYFVIGSYTYTKHDTRSIVYANWHRILLLVLKSYALYWFNIKKK